MAAHVDRIRPEYDEPLLTIADFLDINECYAMLSSQQIGRVVFRQGALPIVTPARYVVSGLDLYLSTGPQVEQHEGINGAVVALEVDELDPHTGEGWTVTVTGIAEPCTHPSRWRIVAGLGLAPLDGQWNRIFRLPAGIVTGRRFAASSPLLKEYPDEALGKATTTSSA
jgi:hypothetical protein